SYYLFMCSISPRFLHSFPTRRSSDLDLIAAYTLNYLEEALGIVEAARQTQMPVAISFTVETDGRLPTGQTLREAIEQVDHLSNRSEEHTSELQSRENLVCRLLLEKKK